MTWKYLKKLVIFTILVLLFCEYIIYYFVILGCSWPTTSTVSQDREDETISALFFSDPHLLGSRQGNWFDKLRREWQMQRAFQTAITLLQPEVIFVLGDLLDEGKWSSDEEFHETVGRFKWMFRHSEDIQLHVVVGNHDIGFHHDVRPDLLNRFEMAFDIPSVKVLSIKNNNFVLLNSMAMQEDECYMCEGVEEKLVEVSEWLNCSRYLDYQSLHALQCEKHKLLPSSAPIVLQHFPMYRESDAICSGADAAPAKEKVIKHRERWEVLSKTASEKLFQWLQPRYILSGHTHHGCHLEHQNGIPELTVPSFSWRNRNNPSFILARISSVDFSFTKCFIPKESTVITTYIIFAVTMVILIIFTGLRPGKIQRWKYL
ncbi:metallophosphoesterase 1-like [Glandiceps talaboti]